MEAHYPSNKICLLLKLSIARFYSCTGIDLAIAGWTFSAVFFMLTVRLNCVYGKMLQFCKATNSVIDK